MFHFIRPYPYLLRLWLSWLALLAAGTAHAVFIDHGDGSVSDTLTGLMWDQCSWRQSGSACATGSASIHTWAASLPAPGELPTKAIRTGVCPTSPNWNRWSRSIP